jgi:hypothetical protein
MLIALVLDYYSTISILLKPLVSQYTLPLIHEVSAIHTYHHFTAVSSVES